MAMSGSAMAKVFSEVTMSKPYAELTESDRKLINRVSREAMKLKLLTDIRMDLQICEIEGWNPKEYLTELQELLNGFAVERGINL